MFVQHLKPIYEVNLNFTMNDIFVNFLSFNIPVQ